MSRCLTGNIIIYKYNRSATEDETLSNILDGENWMIENKFTKFLKGYSKIKNTFNCWIVLLIIIFVILTFCQL